MGKTSTITFTVKLDDNKVPEKIEWQADDAGFNGKKECNSLMISLWDKEDKVTLGIDLWTKEMFVDDMNIHLHQTLLKMADTIRRSTKNYEVADMIQNLGADIAEKLKLKENLNKK